MHRCRRQLLRHPLLAAWLIGIALLMRVAIPAGFMPVVVGTTVTIEICSGTGPMKMTMAMPGMDDHQDKHGDRHSDRHSESPCGFAGLANPSLAGADSILLAFAVAFVIATTFRMVPLRQAGLPSYLRPPLRGPPAAA